MSFDWKEFHDVGVHLENYSPKEAFQRSAVGRYYYSCYHCVKDYFEKNYFHLGHKNSPHQALINCLKTFGSEDEADLADYLSKLRSYRNKADYYQGFRNTTFKKAKKTTGDIKLLLKNLEN